MTLDFHTIITLADVTAMLNEQLSRDGKPFEVESIEVHFSGNGMEDHIEFEEFDVKLKEIVPSSKKKT